MNIEKAQHIHFIGIGGIGISAIAKMMLLEGKRVSGSDIASSLITEKLENDGAVIYIGPHRPENMSSDVDLVIYTVAMLELDPDNPEYKKAKELGIPCITYPQALGEISKGKYTIAISGTHGKTTTTAMCAHIALEKELDPTVVVGSLLKNKGNFIGGKSEYFIVEACEYRRSFLNLSPRVLIITNIEEDHLDYYKDINDIMSAFNELAQKVPKEGIIVCDKENKNVQKALEGVQAPVIDYTEIDIEKDVVSGTHNRKNAQAACGAFTHLGFEAKELSSLLKTFAGTWRRQEYKGKTKKGALVYDDYAHHPSEIRALIQTMRELYPDKKLSILFQPHLYSRTKSFLSEFAEALSKADGVAITDIYAAREVDDGSISGENLTDKINEISKNAIYMKTFGEIVEKISDWADEDDVVVTVGAGDIYKVGEQLII